MRFNLSSSSNCCTVEDNLFDGRECFIAVFTESHVCVMSHISMSLDKFTSVFSTMDRVSISLGSVINVVFFGCLLAKLYVEVRFHLQFRISPKVSQFLLFVQIVSQLLTHHLFYLLMMRFLLF
ncbi:hypothetical protein ALC53_07898 [Atta colombica]|uniref:Uncharacterized protein n=1 Tax=Atta colombica TaxID=520822 RepID=A0A195BBA5_9HYME|nr:hypothetical protein ALC53_07898 [Atta colombica]